MTNAMKKVLFSLISLLLFSVQGNANFTEKEFNDFPTIYSAYYDYYDADFFDYYKQATPKFLQKNWRAYYHIEDGSCLIRNYYIEQGDSIMGERKYARVIVEDRDSLFYRQEGDQVFCIPKGEKEEMVLIDYGLQVGDKFTDPTGSTFTVTETDFFNRYEKNIWYNGRNRQPKTLRLVSTDGEEDIWVEGIGSIYWGILPAYIAKDLASFPNNPTCAKVIYAPGIHMTGLFEVAEEDYKLVYVEPEDIDLSDFEKSDEYKEYLAGNVWKFSFADDTLNVSGIMELNCLNTYVATLVKEGNIDINIGQLYPMSDIPTCGGLKRISAHIPGFKAGTYHIGTQELVCNGAKAETVTYPTIYSEHQQEAWDKLKSRGVTDDAVPTTNYWQVYCVDVDGKFTTLEYAATLRKTTMEGREYLKVGVGKTDTLLYRQEGNKVFMLQDGRELLLLDYALGVGETFTDPWGKRLTVKEAMECEPYYSYLRYFQQGVATFMSKEKPRILRLESEDGLYTDEWIEGIGSTQWGIVPLPVLQTLVACPIGTKWVHIDQASTLSMSAYLDTYEDSYKRAYFVPGYGITESFEQERGFHFVNDTLYVTDRAWLNTGVCYAECKVEGNTVDITTQMTMPETTGMGNHAFVVKFPGFKPGTYEISLNGQEPVTLACNGATADYHPFIEVGKIWKSTITSIVPSEDETEPNYRITEETYTIGKDTLIQGRTCIGMERDRFQKRYFYEDGDKVYCYNTENERFYLIYDFGCQVGDRFTVVDAFSGTMRWWDENFFTCSVRDVDTVKTKDGMELRRITLEAEDVLGEHTTETWIEGIGSVYGPLHNVGATLYMGASMTLDSCTVSNHILYPFSTSTAIRAIDLTPLTRVETPIYDLSGRPVATPRRGLYIKDGKKVSIR